MTVQPMTREYLQQLSEIALNRIPDVEISIFLQDLRNHVLTAANEGHVCYRHDLPERLARFHGNIENELTRQYPGCTVLINVPQREICIKWS